MIQEREGEEREEEVVDVQIKHDDARIHEPDADIKHA